MTSSGENNFLIGDLSAKRVTVTGFAESRQFDTHIVLAKTVADVSAAIKYGVKEDLPICARGHGCSYGDQAMVTGGLTVDLSALRSVTHFDTERGLISVEPGIQLASLIREILPHGWILTGLPGGLRITVGGAVANDVHGKDCWKRGNFGRNVESMTVVGPEGEHIEVSRTVRQDLFHQIIGGMGLFGIVVSITLRLTAIPAPFVDVSTTPTRNLAELATFFQNIGGEDEYAVAWIDGFARGNSFGRGFGESARWSKGDEALDVLSIDDLMILHDKVFGILPADATWGILRHFFFHRGMRLANALKYRATTLKGRNSERILISDFLWIIDKVIPEFNKLLRPDGFLSMQPLLPPDQSLQGIRAVLEVCQKHRCEPILCSVKQHSTEPGPLSFSGNGHSINIDMPLKRTSATAMNLFFEDLMSTVRDLGGKVYLAKDQHLTRELFVDMYPQYESVLEAKAEFDPDNRFISNIYNRLLVN